MKTAMSQPIPRNLGECFAQLETMFEGEEQKERFLEPDRKGKCSAYKYHHGVGRWIRNNWGLWKQEGPLYDYMLELGLEHPDDMSGLILDAFWHQLNGASFSIEDEVKRYQRYWETMDDSGAVLKYSPETVVKFSTKKNKTIRLRETVGTRAITKERLRQIYDEGFTTEHDVTAHPNEELLMAAICYAAGGLLDPELKKKLPLPDDFWPFDSSWNKVDRNTPWRNLEMAGALIAAELDRRDTSQEDISCEECEVKNDTTKS